MLSWGTKGAVSFPEPSLPFWPKGSQALGTRLLKLTLYAPISTYKFSKLIVIHFLQELVERIWWKIKAFSLCQSLIEFCKVALTFECVDEILWCDHSNESSLPVLLHGAIWFLQKEICKLGRHLPLATFGSERVNDHFINSHNIISWQGMDIVRRKLMLVTIGTWRVNANFNTFTLNSFNEKYPFGKKMPAILQHKALSGLPTFSFHNFHVNSAI